MVQSVCTATASRVTCVSVTKTTTVITVMFLSVMGEARVMVMESVMLTTLVVGSIFFFFSSFLFLFISFFSFFLLFFLTSIVFVFLLPPPPPQSLAFLLFSLSSCSFTPSPLLPPSFPPPFHLLFTSFFLSISLQPAIKDMMVSFAPFNYVLRTVKDVEHV